AFTTCVIFRIMLSLQQKRARTRWIGFVVILLPMYVCQVVPHDHPDPGHVENHAVPTPHANHSHRTDVNEEDTPDLPKPAHHHDLAQHVDSHFLRALSHQLNPVSDFALQVVQFRPGPENEPNRAEWIDPDRWLPASIPISPLDSRAPPLLG
ncbi:MAG: hypothetical protein KAI25_01750, partial [Hyphomicrobiaceae bacterium]|nr:hypothetical protein [Hyphomicrobiaceae bacterium]